MVKAISCDKCGSTMVGKRLDRSDESKITIFSCSRCGYNFESGFRFNKLINQYVKYIKFL